MLTTATLFWTCSVSLRAKYTLEYIKKQKKKLKQEPSKHKKERKKKTKRNAKKNDSGCRMRVPYWTSLLNYNANSYIYIYIIDVK